MSRVFVIMTQRIWSEELAAYPKVRQAHFAVRNQSSWIKELVTLSFGRASR